MNKTFKIDKNVSIGASGLIFTALLIGLYYLIGLNDLKQNFGILRGSALSPTTGKPIDSPNLTVGDDLFEVTPGKLCRGGGYMFQGDSADAKFCQNFVKTPEGEEQLCRYQCGGYPGLFNGYPGKKFEYTNQSDNSWENAQCNTLGAISPLGIF